MTSVKTKGSPRAPSARRKRYKNQFFLQTLGQRCRRLRLQKGISIDRLTKGSDQLSPASIDRLERGTGDSQILVLFRYAQALGVSLVDLFSFLKEMPHLGSDLRLVPYEEGVKPSAAFVPVYSIKVAAGKFSDHPEVLDVKEPPLGWIDANLKAPHEDFFATYVYGDSMQPRINDGDLCLFRKYSGGSRQGKIFLIRARSLQDSETGEAFVVKKYMRQTPPRDSFAEEHDDFSVLTAVVHLISENPKYSPIILYGLKDDDIQTMAEFVRVIPKEE